MSAEHATTHAFKLRELQCHDDDGKQFILRVDDDGNVVLTGVFDRQGREVKLGDGYKLELSLRIAIPHTDTVFLAANVCWKMIVVGGVPKWVPCPCP